MEDQLERGTSRSLHTIADIGASEYINESLGDENAALLPDARSSHFLNGAAYEGGSKRNPYFIQHSYNDSHNNMNQGSPIQCGLSPVRRMFLLLSLFDFLLTFLLWVIYLQLKGGVFKEFSELRFDIREKYTDLVVSSLIRSVLLLLFYSCIFKVRKWYLVAFTTTGSTTFLLVKVFYVHFEHGQPLNYLLVIFSFIMCWCEAWHFDFQVVPRELTEDLLAQSIITNPEVNVRPSRYYPSADTRSFPRGPKSSTFFTPYAGSVYRGLSAPDDEDTDSSLSDMSQELDAVKERDRHLIRIGDDTVHMVFRMLYINDGWRLHQKEEDGISVQARHFDGVGNVFKLECIIDVPGRTLDKLFWEDIDGQASWNASVKESQIVTRVNKKTDIVYSVTADVASGIISSRDFVMLRRRKKKGPLTILSCVSIETDLVPEKRSVIRGKNGPGGWILRELPENPDKTEFIWLINTELKGWLPKSLVEQSLSGVMVDTARDIRKHATSLPIV